MRPVNLLPYVRALSKRIGCGAVEPDDLEQVGMLALTVAQREFDEQRGCVLEAYLKGRVRAAMIDEVRRWAGRRGWLHRQRELESAGAELCPAAYPSAPSAPDEKYERREIRGRLRAGIAALPARERQLITLRYGEAPMKAADIAASLGISESRMYQLRARALDRLRRYLRPRGLPL